MLKQLAIAAGRSLGHQQVPFTANAAAPSTAFARLISSSNASAAGAGDRGDHAASASQRVTHGDQGARKMGASVEPRAAGAGDRGEGAASASERSTKTDQRARKMGDAVEPKVHDAFDIAPGGPNASPDPDSAGRVGGMDMGKVVDAVGGMMHGDRGRTERAVGSMASQEPARTAAHGTGQTTSTRWPRSMETTADGNSSSSRPSNRAHPVPTHGNEGSLSSGYGNHSSAGGDVPHPMHMPSDAAKTGPDMGSGTVPGMGDGGPQGQQYNRLNRPGAPNVEDNLGMDAGTQHDDANVTRDTAEGGRDINSSAGGSQP
jgi:hypothetical protein